MPERIGTYQVIRQIGEGAMGVVFEARHEVLGRRVAIKLLRAELAADPTLVARFLQEARAANLATHDNIVGVTDTGETGDGGLYLVMEYLEGESLAELLARRRPRPEEVAHVFDQVLAALEAAHAAGMVHRDLKPANVFLVKRADDPLFVKLLDFGVAKLRGSNLTAAGMMLGSPLYMAPEQISGGTAEPRSDLFAVGVMMYEALAGEPPFRGATLGELAVAITRAQPVPLAQRVPGTPPYLVRMVDRALAREPAARWPDARTMRAELPRTTAARPVVAPPPAPRRRWPVVLALLAVLAGGGVATGLLFHRPPAAVDPRPKAEATLRDALSSPDLAEVSDAVAALALAGGARTAPLLYPVLDGPPELRRQAARALRDLGLPEAAPRLRAALDASGDRLRVSLAADLAALGDKDALPILRRALDEPGARLQAAQALAEAGEAAAARPVLEDVLATAPAGRSEWRGAAEGLVVLGDPRGAAALTGELSAPEPARAVAAAAALARHKDAGGRDFLRRVVADAAYPRRADAALALARAGDAAAAAWVPAGLASADPEERRAALAVAARVGGADAATLARLAAKDPDRQARLVAAAAQLAGSPVSP